MKLLNGIIIAIVSILLLMSLIAIIAIHWTVLDYNVSFTPKGIDTYLSLYGNYKALFTGTIITTAAYFGFLRVKVSEDANREKIKQDYFTEWKTIIQVRAAEVVKYDKLMLRELVKIRYSLFNDLYDLEFKIESNEILTAIFDNHIKSRVSFFESMNDKCVGMGGIYPNNTHSYSFDAFKFIFFGMIDNYYDEMEIDLKKLYVVNMDKNRTIDLNLYKTALQNYKPI